MEASQYRQLSQAEWDAAQAEDFLFTLPCDVKWGAMDTQMLQRYWAAYPAGRAAAPAETADRILVFQRGAEVVSGGDKTERERAAACACWDGLCCRAAPPPPRPRRWHASLRAGPRPRLACPALRDLTLPPCRPLLLPLPNHPPTTTPQAHMQGGYYMFKVNLLISMWILQPLVRLWAALMAALGVKGWGAGGAPKGLATVTRDQAALKVRGVGWGGAGRRRVGSCRRRGRAAARATV